MAMTAGKTEETVRAFYQAYLTERDLEKTMSFLDENILWADAGRRELADGPQAVLQILRDELREDASYAVRLRDTREQILSEDSAVFFCVVEAVQKQEKGPDIILESRVTAVCRMRGEACKIVSLHASVLPLDDGGQQRGAAIVEKDNQARIYDHLFHSVLCGIVQYYLRPDGSAAYKSANQEAIRIFGYDAESFWAKKDWNLRYLIAEEDRERILREAGQLHNIGDKNDYEYRVFRRDKSVCWIIGNAQVIDRDGDTLLIQSVFINIDKSKNAEIENQLLSEQVEAGNLLLRMALEHTTTCEFYYYPQERLGIFPQRTCRQYHCRERYEDMPESLARDLVAEKWGGAYYQMFDHIHQGRDTGCAEFRARDGMTWCRITMSVVSRAEDKNPTLIVGIIEDITMAKEMELALEDAHTRDELTGLYNREAGIGKVKEYMRRKDPARPCCMMLLDMDNFAVVNSEEGRVFADAVLQDVARVLRSETGPEDIQIRLGGDEFMLFLKDCGKRQATAAGQRITEKIKALLPDNPDVRVSASLGLCQVSAAQEYNELYRCAESTLQYVKANGKGRACCYLDTSNALGSMLTQLYTDEYLFNEIEESIGYREDDLVAFALELLGKSRKLDDAISLLLSRIGKSLQLDRVSIAEMNAEYLSIRYTYQWVRSSGDSQTKRAIYLSREQLDSILDFYDEDGFSNYVNPTESAMPVSRHIAIWNQGAYAGSVGFESRDPGYQWTQERKKTAKELTKIIASFIMKARADSVSKAKSEFLSRMSHEIRTPMNAVSGMTAIAKTVAGDREKTLECLEKIEYANSYLLDLINDVLDMSRIESGKMVADYGDVDLRAFWEKLQVLMSPQAEQKGISLTLKNAYEENRLVRADHLHLNQVLVNIVGNAVKFTEPGGSVTVAMEPVALESDLVRIRFSVRDTGIGIEKRDLGRIFNAFEQAQANSKYGGTGLGLAISSRLVQMMGGVLEVKSKRGVGTEFYFTLSFPYSSHQALPKAPEEPARPVDFVGLRILLAEDNALNREIAETILQMNGFTVESAENGEDAVKLFGSHAPGYYDAVLMDIRMPVMDGLEATRTIRTLGKADSVSIPIIAMTANAFDEDSRKSMENGMNGHLTKPLVIDNLFALLRECLEIPGTNQ